MTRPTVVEFTRGVVSRIESIIARYLSTNGYTAGGGAGGTLTDGDKGDITVSGSGATWNIDAGAVGTAELAGDAVTYAKMQNVSAASRLLGRGSASGAGDVEELTLGSGLALTGTVLDTTGSGGGLSHPQVMARSYFLS